MEKHIELNKKEFEEFLTLPINGSLKMLNLLKFKESVNGSGLSGAEQYKKYMTAATPFFEKANAKIIFYGQSRFTLIGPKEEWDKVLIVEYASKTDFITMITAPGYPAELRAQALVDARLIFCG